jgi:hypothetical protein
MGNKKNRGGSGKIIAKREEPAVEAPKKAEPAPEPALKRKVPERIQEKDAGFGVIKVIAGVVIALIVGVSLLSHFFGGDDASRGSSGQDERCQSTTECKSGFICQAYAGDAERCLKLCEPDNPQSCEPGYECASSARSAGRKKMRLAAVCVPDAKAN